MKPNRVVRVTMARWCRPEDQRLALDIYEFRVVYKSNGRFYTINIWGADELDAWRKADEALNGQWEKRVDEVQKRET